MSNDKVTPDSPHGDAGDNHAQSLPVVRDRIMPEQGIPQATLSKPVTSDELEKSVAAALAEPIEEMLPEHEALLEETLEQAIAAVAAARGFLALVDLRTGELAINITRGEGWNEAKRGARVPIAQRAVRGITGQVATTGRPYRCGDVSQDPYYIEFFTDVVSELAVPLVDRSGRTIGVLNVDSTEPNAFDERQERHLMALANRAAMALSLAHYQAREHALIEIGKALSSETAIRQLVSKITKVTTEILPAEGCSIFLYDHSARKLSLADSYNQLTAQSEGSEASYELGYGLTGWVGMHRQSIRVTDPSKDPRWKGLHLEMIPEDIGAFLAVPICGHDELLGVLRAVRRRRSAQAFIPSEFSDADEDIMWTLASQVAIAIENTHLVRRVVSAERMAALGEMSARTAHMIGNAVFGIKGQINEFEYLLSDGKPDNEVLSDLIIKMKREVFRVDGMLKEFRDFVRTDQLQPVPTDVNVVVEEAVRCTLPGERGMHLCLELLPDLPTLQADPSKLQSAISELIENSVAEQPEGGQFLITTGLATQHDIMELSRSSVSREFVKVVVADRGRGVADALKKKIFEPFYSTKSRGMGLGLAIVKGIIEAHQGIIKEVGAEGIGAKFVILLPANG